MTGSAERPSTVARVSVAWPTASRRSKARSSSAVTPDSGTQLVARWPLNRRRADARRACRGRGNPQVPVGWIPRSAPMSCRRAVRSVGSSIPNRRNHDERTITIPIRALSTALLALTLTGTAVNAQAPKEGGGPNPWCSTWSWVRPRAVGPSTCSASRLPSSRMASSHPRGGRRSTSTRRRAGAVRRGRPGPGLRPRARRHRRQGFPGPPGAVRGQRCRGTAGRRDRTDRCRHPRGARATTGSRARHRAG